MNASVVTAPGSLLLDQRLTPAAKLVWMLLRLGEETPGGLAVRSGLALYTVKRAIAGLESLGWLPAPQAELNPCASVPVDLLLEQRVSAQAKVLYGTLQVTAGFAGSKGQVTYAELSGLTGACPNTVKLAFKALQESGWLKSTQKNQLHPIEFGLRNPIVDRGQGEVVEADLRLSEWEFTGEALMREYLNLLVNNDEFEDNATPGFLVNPYTGEELQYDRYYYRLQVAYEFNGAQHDGPTDRFPKEAQARRQMGRDYIKLGISVTRGITLVVVRPTDLSLAEMRRKVEGLLPLRDLKGHELLVEYLDLVGRSYLRKARKEGGKRAADAPTGASR